MKKRLLVLLILLLVLTGCAGYQPKDGQIQPNLYFSETSLTYTETPRNDIFYQIGNIETDFFILYQVYRGYPLEQSAKDNYHLLLSYLKLYQSLNATSYTEILNYTSKELNDALDSIDVTPSITDVVVFNEIKTFVQELKSNQYSGEISKNLYIELRLGRTLTQDEIASLEVLQYYYQKSYEFNQQLLFEQSFDSFFETISTLDQSVDDSLKNTLMLSYDLLQVFNQTKSHDNLQQ